MEEQEDLNVASNNSSFSFDEFGVHCVIVDHGGDAAHTQEGGQAVLQCFRSYS